MDRADGICSIRKIYTSNILQFMQFDTYEARYNLFKVARVVADTTVVLGATDAPHLRMVRNYAISMDELVSPEPGAIYFVEIRGMEPLEEEDFWDSDAYFGDYETYDERCTFLIASDLALIAKDSDNKTEVFACDILSGKPLAGVRIKLYDYVLQEIGKAVTDKDGRASFPAGNGHYVIANSDKGAAYLALKNEKSLSLLHHLQRQGAGQAGYGQHPLQRTAEGSQIQRRVFHPDRRLREWQARILSRWHASRRLRLLYVVQVHREAHPDHPGQIRNQVA